VDALLASAEAAHYEAEWNVTSPSILRAPIVAPCILRPAVTAPSTFRLFCPACAGVLHEGSGYYSLSELAVVLSFDPAATTEAEASSLSKESPPVRRHQKCKNPR
jgi:hypothetical protein